MTRRRWSSSKLFLAVFLGFGFSPALGADAILSGHAQVTDGDTFRIAGTKTRIRLHGIDAPEIQQSCERDAACYPCGEQSKAALVKVIQDQEVRCERTGKSYNRVVARCFVGGVDIAAAMIEGGWVVVAEKYLKKAEKTRYLAIQNTAMERRSGIYAGDFVIPAEWRNKGKRLFCEPVEATRPN